MAQAGGSVWVGRFGWIAVAIVAGIGAWWFAAIPLAPSVAAPAEYAESAPAPATAIVEPTPVPFVAAEADPARVALEATPTTTNEPTSPSGVRVRVVDVDATPLEGALVWWNDGPARAGIDEVGRAAARAEGRSATTDAKGLVVLAIPVSRDRVWRVYASNDDAVGWTTIGGATLGSDEEQRIQLVAAPPIRVSVRTHDGAPASGIAVVAGVWPEPWQTAAEAYRNIADSSADVGVTDDDGWLTIRHPQLLRTLPGYRSRSPGTAPSIHLTTRILGLETDRFVLDIDDAAMPRLWTLAPTGTVEFVVAGERPTALDRFEVGRVAELGPRAWAFHLGSWSAPESSRTTPIVITAGLGIRLAVAASLGVTRFDVTAAGPTVAHERIRVVLQAMPEACALVGRVSSDAREPLAFGQVLVELQSADGRRSTLRGRGDETVGVGGFRITIGAGERGATKVGGTVRFVDGGMTVAEASLPGIVLPREGALDLGELHVRPTPVLAAGTVRIGGVAATEGSVSVALDPADTQPGRAVARAKLDRDGHFVLRGRTDAATLWLRTNVIGASRGAPLEVRTGSTNLRLDLQPSTDLDVVLVLPAPRTPLHPSAQPFISFVTTGSSGAPRIAREFVHDPIANDTTTSRSLVRDIDPATDRVRVHLPGASHPVLDELLDLGQLETTGGLRRLRLDLRGRLHATQLRIVGAPSEDPVVATAKLRVGTNSSSYERPFLGATTSLLVPTEGIDVEVTDIFGRQVVRLPGLRADVDVTLADVGARGIGLTFSQADALPATVRVEVTTSAADGAVLRRSMLARRGPHRVPLPSGERCRLTFAMHAFGRSIELPAAEQWVEIDQTSMEVVVPPAQWQEAHAEALRR